MKKDKIEVSLTPFFRKGMDECKPISEFIVGDEVSLLEVDFTGEDSIYKVGEDEWEDFRGNKVEPDTSKCYYFQLHRLQQVR